MAVRLADGGVWWCFRGRQLLMAVRLADSVVWWCFRGRQLLMAVRLADCGVCTSEDDSC